MQPHLVGRVMHFSIIYQLMVTSETHSFIHYLFLWWQSDLVGRVIGIKRETGICTVTFAAYRSNI